MNLIDEIADRAADAPEVPALVLRERTLDRGGLAAAIRRAAAGLAAAGLAPGTVAAVVPAADRMLHVVVTLALAHLGIVHLPLRAQDAAQRGADLARRFGAGAAIADHAPADLGLPLVRPSPSWLDGADAAAPPAERAGGRAWIVALSSGTTGQPKAIAVSHAMEVARNRRDRQCFRHRVGEPYMTLIETGFYNSTSAIVRCLGQGGTVVLDHDFASIAALLECVRARRVRFLQMTPSHLFAVVEALPDGQPALPDLRVLRVSSAALPPRILDLARRRLADRVHVTYGTNEAGTLAVATPDMLARDPAIVGRPLAGIEFEIVDAADHPVPAGHAGFVRVRGPGVMDGYLGDEAATRRHCRDGWFHPGDLAARDADGLVRLRGRADRTMNIGGVLTAAEEIEAVLATHPAVADAAVAAVASERFQVVPSIAVVLRRPVPVSDLVAHVRRSMHAFPLALTVVPALPRNPMGKIDYPAVARLLAERAAAPQADASAGNSGRSRS